MGVGVGVGDGVTRGVGVGVGVGDGVLGGGDAGATVGPRLGALDPAVAPGLAAAAPLAAREAAGDAAGATVPLMGGVTGAGAAGVNLDTAAKPTITAMNRSSISNVPRSGESSRPRNGRFRRPGPHPIVTADRSQYRPGPVCPSSAKPTGPAAPIGQGCAPGDLSRRSYSRPAPYSTLDTGESCRWMPQPWSGYDISVTPQGTTRGGRRV